MVAIKKILVANLKKTKGFTKGRTLHLTLHEGQVRQMNTLATLSFTKLVRLIACQLKDCNNEQEKEKEETGSRNDLLQSC